MKSTAAMPATRSTRDPGSSIATMQHAGVHCIPTVRVKGIQPQLTVSRTGDASEQEADRVADIVTKEGARHAKPLRINATPGPGFSISHSAAERVTATIKTGGQPLDDGTRQFMEQRFAKDFSGVRVHADSDAQHSASSVGANAYTIGDHIVFGANQFTPATQSGKRLIAHELSHVVQQSQGAAPVVAREVADDPDAKVSLGYLDNKYVSMAAEQLLGPRHWVILREFLRGMWGGLQAAPADQRARIDKKMQDFDVGNALKYTGGYAIGIVEGLWASIKGLAEAAVTLVALPYNIGKFLGDRVPPLAVKYGPRIAEIMMDRDGIAGPIRNALGKFLASPAKTVRQLGTLFNAIGALALHQVRKLGHGLADEALKVLEQPWFEYGRSVGKLAGQVLFEVILAVASDAIANIVKEALAFAARLSARVVSGVAQLIKSAGRFVGEAVEWVGRLGRRAAGEVGEMFEGLRALLNRVKALLAELGEEAALTDAGGLHMPIPDSKAVNLESRALGPPGRPPNGSSLTPPKVHPSNAGAQGTRSRYTSKKIGGVMDEASGGTSGGRSIQADEPYRVADEAVPKGLTDPTRRAEGDAARDSLRKATPKAPSRLWQKHHLVPWELREHAAVYEYERMIAKVDNPRAVENIGNRWMNRAENNLTMPSAKGLPGGEGMTIHRGSHPRYTNWMEGRLDQLWGRYHNEPLPIEEFGRLFEGLIGEGENALRTGVFGKKLR